MLGRCWDKIGTAAIVRPATQRSIGTQSYLKPHLGHGARRLGRRLRPRKGNEAVQPESNRSLAVYFAAVMDFTWMVLPSSVPVTVTFCAANFSGVF